MNKGIIGWIFSALVLFGCLVVLGVGGYFGYTTYNELTKTKADLATANDNLAQTTADLDKANTDITKLNGDLTDAKDQAAQLQSSLDDMTSLKTAAETRFNKTVCKTTKTFDYSSYNALQAGISTFIRTVPDVPSSFKNQLIYGLPGTGNLWLVMIVDGPSNFPVFFFYAYPDQKATYFGNDACWLQAPE
jgi:hypothetical protein